MANTKKMTKRDYFAILRASYPEDAANYKDVIAFIDHEVELLDRKNSGERKPTATQQMNAVIKERILDFMKPNRLYTVTEIQKGVEVPEGVDELSNQKVSALLRQLDDAGKVVKTVDKRKTFYSLVV